MQVTAGVAVAVRRSALVLVLPLVALVVGCGGGSSGPADTVKDFAQKWSDGDYSGACDLLGGHATFAVITEGMASSVGEVAPGEIPGVNDEERACAFWLEHMEGDVQGDLSATISADVIDEDEEGDVARAELDTANGQWLLSESGGDWIIQEIPFVRGAQTP